MQCCGARMNMPLAQLLGRAHPVLPVLTIASEAQAVPLAAALHAAGCGAVEVTLRTPVALAAIAAMRAAVPGLIVGAGTVLDRGQLDAVLRAGAQFVVTPGLSAPLCRAAAEAALPLLPGVMTPSEMMEALALGIDCVKLFPAVPTGGAAWLKAMSGPFPQLRFCPTGGVNADNYRALLALENVLCVGGSWFIEADALAEERWDRIEETTRAALVGAEL